MRRSRDMDALCQAVEQEGCPICLVTLESLERVMESWQYEGFSDPANRLALVDAQGFCPRHTWQLTRLPTGFQLALVYREIFPEILAAMKHHLEQISAHKQGKSRSFWNRLKWKHSKQPEFLRGESLFPKCLFCQRQAEIEQHLTDALLTMLSDQDLRFRLNQATGLCMPHLAQAYHRATSGAQRAALLEYQISCLQRNLAEVEELVRKHDYRFLDEPQGNEMTAWRRAIQLLVGNRGIR